MDCDGKTNLFDPSTKTEIDAIVGPIACCQSRTIASSGAVINDPLLSVASASLGSQVLHPEEPKGSMDKKKGRSDADRRARQSERLGRLLRVLTLISGSGRWDAESLAKELECSTRTIHRLLQSLIHAGIPWYFDEKLRAYRIRPGFKTPKLHFNKKAAITAENLLSISRQLESDMERILAVIRQFKIDLETS